DSVLDFYGQQSMAARSCIEAGECFVRLRPRLMSDGLSVPLQLQVLEAELCSEYWTTTAPTPGNVIRAGIEFNAIGARVAYWFYRRHPGDSVDQFQVPNAVMRVPVPADMVVHLYDPTRPGQLRGVTALAAALTKLRDLDEFDDASLFRQKLANLFTGF